MRIKEVISKFSYYVPLYCFWMCGSDDFMFLGQNINILIISGFYL